VAIKRYNMSQGKQKGKGKILRKSWSVSFVKVRGTWRRISPSFRNNLKRKINQSYFSIMNIIWLMLFIIYGGVILVLQSIFWILRRVSQV
jgi:hypothetical protein